MTDAAVAQIVTGCVTIALAAISAYFANKAKQQSEANARANAEAAKVIQSTHDAVNGKMEEFKRMAEAYFRSEGARDEKAAEKGRRDIAEEAVRDHRKKDEPTKVIGPTGGPLPVIEVKPPE